MESKNKQNTKEALRWIVKILRKRHVSFQISGGLAAQLHGSSRPLVDIDIDIPQKKFDAILPDVKACLIFGPQRFKDKQWDLFLMTLNYKGQRIDIGSAEAKIYNAMTKKWESNSINFKRSQRKKLYGLLVPIMRKEDLIKFKKMLDRPVDRKDLIELLQ